MKFKDWLITALLTLLICLTVQNIAAQKQNVYSLHAISGQVNTLKGEIILLNDKVAEIASQDAEDTQELIREKEYQRIQIEALEAEVREFGWLKEVAGEIGG